MTTKEASWLAKKTAMGEKIKLKYRDIECETITDADMKKQCEFHSENNFANPFSGIYIWYNTSLESQYSMCVRDSSGSVYQCNIKDLELILNNGSGNN